MRSTQSSRLVWLPNLPLLPLFVLFGALPASAVASPPGLLAGPPALAPGPGLIGLQVLGGIGSTDISPPIHDLLSSVAPLSSTSTSYFASTKSTTSHPSITASPALYSSAPAPTNSTLAPSSTPRPPTTIASSSVTTSISISISEPSSGSGAGSSGQMSRQHRDLIIILSVVLGVVGLLVIGAAILLIYRYRQGKSPFNNRGASPINDDEIQSWRTTGLEPKHAHSSSDPRSIVTRDVSIDSIALGRPAGWAAYPQNPAMVHPNLPPSSLGRAPNARAGLTDETIPGAAPFVDAGKRHNSRLVKPPPGHGHTKSRRSSISAKSMRSYTAPSRIPTWYDPDSAEAKEMGYEHRISNSNSPDTSNWDAQSIGGLSPRPKSQVRHFDKEDEIGRAIS